MRLEESSALLRAVLDSSPDAIVVVTPDSVLRLASAATYALLGYRPEELIGRPLSLILPPELGAAHETLLARYRPDSGSSVIGTVREVEAVRRDGSRVAVEIYVGQAQSAGRLLLTGVIRAVSRRRTPADERRPYTEELERAVAARTRELEERTAALAVALRAAESAERAKSEFLRNVSHELRTPLAAIIGFAELLAGGDGPSREEARDYGDIIGRNALAMLRQVDDVLTLSCLAAGDFQAENTHFSPGRVLEDVMAALEPRAAAKGLVLALERGPALPAAIDAARGPLKEILTHLISNAVKFTERGQIRVFASGDAGALRIEVRDGGPGIAPERLPCLFRPFSQLDGSPSRPHGGAGLGLAICRRLADLIGATLEVESASGVGSTFRLTLPIQR